MSTKEYSNGEVSIVWKPEKCIHSGICVKTLPKVYNPKERPWIKAENASSEEIIRQVSKCPSGALSIRQESKTMIKIDREDNGRKGRFVIYDHDAFAGEMTYVWAGESRFIIDHTGIEENFIGRGLGKQLVMKAVAYARNNDLKILPLCPFAKKVFDRDDGIQDVRA
ncbi:GNAT family N-acetyltransferase [Catalinimonas niigatensis]|uniref:GNAT family N-acetyltransferase n=1 Tax=Catalinimonas niigatensis TaxID=1397264 RepID=UPI002665D830|nr:GNAT family N-acetyltransferase [Catalinimonas niigatensis]WPP48723.1 (4Fe-4S)-binding protein [Catalinimonas niigatensis]